MLYEGPTVQAAMAAALGAKKSKLPTKPSSYGKPITATGKTPAYGSTGKPAGKPSSFGKQQAADNPYATPEAIARARDTAIQDARSWIGSADVSEGAHERAIVYIYDTRTGHVRTLSDSQAGSVERSSFSSTDRHFRFQFSWHPNREVILATAHSHPHANRAGGTQAAREANRLDRLNEDISLNRDDMNLRRIAPVVLKTPSGAIRVFLEPGGYD